MTLEQFISYLSRHSGYSFSKTKFNDDYVMRFVDEYITEENGKFYLLAFHDDRGAPITKNSYVICTHILSYRVNRYYIGSIYELSVRKEASDWLTQEVSI